MVFVRNVPKNIIPIWAFTMKMKLKDNCPIRKYPVALKNSKILDVSLRHGRFKYNYPMDEFSMVKIVHDTGSMCK